VKTVHEEGISVYALILEGVNCTERGAGNTCLDSLDAALDYNEKSLAPFDGVAIYVNSFGEEGSEESTIDYRTLFETANKEVKGNVSISASLPLDYNASQIEEIVLLLLIPLLLGLIPGRMRNLTLFQVLLMPLPLRWER